MKTKCLFLVCLVNLVFQAWRSLQSDVPLGDSARPAIPEIQEQNEEHNVLEDFVVKTMCFLVRLAFQVWRSLQSDVPPEESARPEIPEAPYKPENHCVFLDFC